MLRLTGFYNALRVCVIGDLGLPSDHASRAAVVFSSVVDSASCRCGVSLGRSSGAEFRIKKEGQI